MDTLLIMLSPPRSFSSVVSTVIGEHPDLYGFPELHLFVADTIGQLIEYEIKTKHRYCGPHGLLRTIAEIHEGVQTTETVARAIAWLHDRRDWSTKEMMDYLLEKVAPQLGVEKSPVTARTKRSLNRVYKQYPHAFFLHLVRHPISATKSREDFNKDMLLKAMHTYGPKLMYHTIEWYEMHRNIMELTSQLPVGQTMRIKGEDVLSEPDLYLPQICEWMGIRTDREAIEAMKHPENSPYSCIGPMPARGGNDHKFMMSPKLRSGKVREPYLDDYLPSAIAELNEEEIWEMSRRIGLTKPSAEGIIDEVTKLTNLFGYR